MRGSETDSIEPLVELRGITKRFSSVVANDNVSFIIRAGHIHGLLGENGAGKSTLMSILCGFHRADSGEILIGGRKAQILSPADAAAHGIGIVQQHFSLVPTMTVAENVVLGAEGSAVLRPSELSDRVSRLSERYRLGLEPDALVGDLSVGQRQRVELAKTLIRSRRVLVLDEPTTVLTAEEVSQLFETLRGIAAQGSGVVIITHKLDELMAVTDDITVMRAGRSVLTQETKDTSLAALATEMVGRSVDVPWLAASLGVASPDGDSSPEQQVKSRSQNDSPVLEVRDITVCDRHNVRRLDGVSLEIHAGEILGIAGVEGNGQRELVGALAGITTVESGTVAVQGRLTRLEPSLLRDAGVRVITEDRHESGVVLDMTLLENLICDRLDHDESSRFGVIHQRRTSVVANRLIGEYEIKAPHCHVAMRKLSGGNQQKAVLARELSLPTSVLVAAQPTRGLDLGAISDVVGRILGARDSGVAVLYVSSDLAELRALCDRVAVLNGGALSDAIAAQDATAERMGALMAGVEPI